MSFASGYSTLAAAPPPVSGAQQSTGHGRLCNIIIIILSRSLKAARDETMSHLNYCNKSNIINSRIANLRGGGASE